MVWQTLITSCYKELIDSLTKWLALHHMWFMLNILDTPCNFQKTLKTIKR